MTRIFNVVLLQQTQPQDSHGDQTLTQLYTSWYLDSLLRRATLNHICYAPRRRAFVSLASDRSMLPLRAEDYASSGELLALAEIMGPFGMKHLNENLAWNIATHFVEIKVRCFCFVHNN